MPIPEGAEPPSEFRIWTWGENDTLQGKVVLDRKAAEAVIANYVKHGVELSIDYEHQTFNAEDNGKEAPAAGWFTPEIRDDGLWATNVHWTDKASAYLKSREYRYFSPSVELDSKTRKPVRLMPMALTNWPATKNLEPLVARAPETHEEDNHMKTVLVALGLKADADEAAAEKVAGKLRKFKTEVLALAGKESGSEAIGVLTALRMKAEKADALETELAKLKADQVAAEKGALIDEAIKGGVAPAKRAELEALDLGALKVCLSLLPKRPEAAQPPAKAPAVASALTAEEAEIVKMTGLTPEKFLEHRKAYKAQIEAFRAGEKE